MAVFGIAVIGGALAAKLLGGGETDKGEDKKC